MRFEVTEDDIKNGRQHDCGKCPMALAIARKLGGASKVTVGSYTLTIWRGTYILSEHRLTDRMKEFIARFDKGEKVSPGDYEYSDALLGTSF